MYQLLPIFVGLLYAGETWGKETNKGIKSLPGIANSIINLGKIDITLHMNSKNALESPATFKYDHTHPMNTNYMWKSDVETEPCPCSTLKNFKNPFLNNPSEILNKILKSNDLFSHNQEQVNSPMCCESHEHFQEDAVFYEFAPKIQPETFSFQNSLPNLGQIPFFESIFPKSSKTTVTAKPKAIEIFFFPKKKDSFTSLYDLSKSVPIKTYQPLKKKEDYMKNDIQIVGDKELKNEFKDFKYRSTYPLEYKKEEQPQEKNKIEIKITGKENSVEETTMSDTTLSTAPNSL